MTTKELDSSLQHHYPTPTTPPEILISWAREYDVALHPSGLVLPEHREENKSKIVKDFDGFRERLDPEREKGKHIVILPGSYDGVHGGHLSFVIQAIQAYLDDWNNSHRNEQINRSDVFVATLLDDDQLIAEVKKDAYLKVIGRKGPIETIEERTAAMAELPLDLVGIAPSPLSDKLPKPTSLQHDEMKQMLSTINRSIPNAVTKSVENYGELLTDIENGQASFDSPWWSIESWQLYVLSTLNQQALEGKQFMSPITRVLSTDEHKYFNSVASLMKICKINVLEIDDIFCMSTKQIVEKVGADGLLDIKRSKEID